MIGGTGEKGCAPGESRGGEGEEEMKEVRVVGCLGEQFVFRPPRLHLITVTTFGIHPSRLTYVCGAGTVPFYSEISELINTFTRSAKLNTTLGLLPKCQDKGQQTT